MAWYSHGPVDRLRRVGPGRVDVAVAIGLLIAIEVVAVHSSGIHARVPAVVGGAVLSLTVAGRRRWPLGALIAGVSAVVAQDAFGGNLIRTAVATIPAGIMLFYAAAAFLPQRRSRVALALGLAGLWLDVAITTRTLGGVFAVGIMVGMAPWAVGRMLRASGAKARAYRELAERLDAERELQVDGAVGAERVRIARGLHDIIAHSVSVMVIQAGGARTVMATDAQRADTALRCVEQAGREALAEMRRLLGLHDGASDHAALAPQPGLADVEDLVVRARAAGLVTVLRVEGTPVRMPPSIDLCAYRIIQEALTNTIKHAGQAHAVVCLRWTNDALGLEISDDGAAGAVGNGHLAGHGLAGIRERVSLHGGAVEARPGKLGGFVVRARLSIVPEAGL